MGLALIVDDHVEGLYLLRCLLEPEGFEVIEARNGREALGQAKGRAFDLVVSDILMPVMDGFSLCRVWKADPELRRVPFVFYTATYVDKRDEDLALSLGADLFLVKPTEPAVFQQRVRALLAEQRDGKLQAKPETATEAPFLQQYNEVLIHKLEDKLQELERASQSLRIKDFALASSPSGIVLTRMDGQVTYANPAILLMAGRPSNEVLERPIRSLFAAGAAFDAWLAREEKGAPVEMQLAPRPDASSGTWLRVEKHTITDEAHMPLGLMFSCADVTEERTLRYELARIQRLEALSLFAAGVAHDFNNLLMAIFAGLELEGTRNTSAEAREENRAMALAAFERARDLTRRLLTFAKHSTAERRPTDLRQLLDESLLLGLSGSGVDCQKRYCHEAAVAAVDPGQMAQVFSNLIVNARQAMKDQGTLIASVSLCSLPATDARGTLPAVKVSIADNGPGIPLEILPNIFEPYFTTKREGSGLGLATSHAIMHEHGGQISVSSQPGKGARFELAIPAVRTEQAPPVIAAPRQLEVRSGRVLVMDDQAAIQSLLRQGLERIGYSVVIVSNGEQALLEFRRANAEGRPFDLFLLDITIRGGMGGLETLAELRRLTPKVLAIATTGYAAEAAVSELQRRGFARVITKPFLLHELYATIKAVLP
jgi:CheY-like chemotaxis protein/nitrogen-specific signal transduction histidine kinase